MRRRNIEDYIERMARKIAARGGADPSSFAYWRGPPKEAGEKKAAEGGGREDCSRGGGEHDEAVD